MTESVKIKVTPVANAGILLEYGGVKLLIDGIFSAEGHTFGGIPQDSWGKLLHAQPPFDGIDSLLFTHCHPDHFSPELTLEYLQSNRVESVFLPEAEGHGALTAFLKAQKIPCVPLCAELDCAWFDLSPEVSVRILPKKHLDRRYAGEEHYSFLLRFGDKRLLVTGDADYVNESFSELDGMRLAAVFLNPLFFSALCRRRFFTGSFDCPLYCVYHLPFEQDGCESAALSHELLRWDSDRGKVILLNKKDRNLLI